MGNRDLHPEEIRSYEAGYQALVLERLRVRVDLFYNQVAQLIATGPLLSQVSPLLPPIPTGGQFVNVGGGEIFGGEVGFDVFIASWLQGFLNYSYQERRGDIRAMGFAPHHKGNAGVTFSFPHGLSAHVLVHYVGESEGPSGFPPVIARVDPYTLVNLRLGHRFKVFGNEAELTIQAFNLFNDVHREVPGGDLIERRVSGTIRYRF